MFRSLIGSRRAPAVRPQVRRPALAIHSLEDRVTPNATLYVGSFFDSSMYQLDETTGTIRNTLIAPYSGGPLNGLAGLTQGPDGNLYLSSQLNDTILKYDLSQIGNPGYTPTTFIGPDVLSAVATDDGATTFSPAGLVFGPDGNLYVSLNSGYGSTLGAVVRFNIDYSGGSPAFTGSTTVLPTDPNYYTKQETTFATNVVEPTSLLFGTATGDTDNLYVSNQDASGQGQVSEVVGAPFATNSTTAAGFIAPGANGLDSAAGLAWLPNGDLLVDDLGQNSHVGQLLEYSGTTFVQNLDAGGNLAFQFPSDVKIDASGNILTANLGPAYPPNLQGSVFEFDPSGNLTGTLVDSSRFPSTGPGTSGISPSQMVFVPNQAPVLTVASSGGYTEGDPATPLDALATVSDPDSPDFDTGTLTVSISANATAADELRIIDQGILAGQIGVTGSAVTYGGTPIGTFTGGVGSDLVVTFSGTAATPAAVQALLDDVAFFNTSQNPSTLDRTVSFTLTDGDGGTSATADETVTVTAVDNPPAVTTNTALTAPRNGLIVITQAALEATDPDNTPDELQYVLNSGPTQGFIEIGGLPISSFTQADINNGVVTYVNGGSGAATDSFDFTVQDPSLKTTTGTFHLTIDTPPKISTNTGFAAPQGGSAVINSLELAATDSDNTPAQLTFTVSSIPAHGTILVGGLAASSFTQDDVNNGKVSYQNDGTSNNPDSFQVTVSDGPFGDGPATVNVTVDAVPQVTTNTGMTANQGATTTITKSELETTDADNTAGQLTYTVTTAPAHGTLEFGGLQATMFTQDQINNGQIVYVQDGSRVTSDSFAFTVSDGSVGTTSGSFAITIDTIPQVTTNPGDVTAFAGTQVTFNAAANASPSPTVQWQVSTDGGMTFTNILGATATTYSFKPAAGDDNSQYRAVFTNPAGTVNSAAATLHITPGLAITGDPQGATATLGQKVKFAAAASGTKVKVQWQVSTDGGLSFANVKGGTRTTLTVVASAAVDGHLYRAAFTNAAGTAYTTAAPLVVDYTVNANKTRKVTVAAGTNITLNATPSAKFAGATVQWFVSTDKGKTYSPVAGATSTSLTLTPALADNGAKYQAVFTLGGAKSTLAPVTLTVGSAPTTTDPSPASGSVGGTATFSVSVGGTGPVRVQWEVSTDGGKTFALVGGPTTNTTLTLKKLKASQNGAYYRAVVTNAFGHAESDIAKLTVA